MASGVEAKYKSGSITCQGVCVRRYNDPVEVRRGWVKASEIEGPAQFMWRGRIWKVREIVASWVETHHWWATAYEAGSDLLNEHEVWRVEARRPVITKDAIGSNNSASHTPTMSKEQAISGVFDLAFSWNNGSWRLVGCLD
jgi:hypothetical protein